MILQGPVPPGLTPDIVFAVYDVIWSSAFLIVCMFWTSHKYPENYYFSAFWLLMNSWAFVLVINAFTLWELSIIYPLTMLTFNVLFNMFHIIGSVNENKLVKMKF